MKRVFVVFIFFVFGLGSLQAEPLSLEDVKKIKKQRVVEHVLYEMYLNTDSGAASVFGYHFDVFFHSNIYFTTAIFGAVGGNRGGYGIAAFGGGYVRQLVSKLFLDSKLIIGSGGGGGLKAGGGFAVEGMSGISFPVKKNFFIDVKGGYLTFPTGSFSTPILNFGFSYQRNRFYLPF